jgi:integrase
MAVYDRWHTHEPRIVDGLPVKPCKHSRGKHKLYPSADHGQGDRWQVRWRDPSRPKGKQQQKKNFELLGGGTDEVDPERYAKAFDAQNTHALNTDSYVDPKAGQVLLEEYAKEWLKGQAGQDGRLRVLRNHLAHIYNVEAGPRSARRKGPSPIGSIPIATLAKRPSLIQKWVKSLEAKKLSPNYQNQIAGTLSSIFISAIDDGIVGRNPVRARSVRLPSRAKPKARCLTRAQLDLVVESLGCDALVAWLGVSLGLRQGEIFGLAVEDIDFLGHDRKVRVLRQVAIEYIERENGTKEGVPVFRRPKRGKEREVPLADNLGLKISAHIKAYPPRKVTLPWGKPDGPPVTANLLFWSTLGGVSPYTDGYFKYRWRRARKVAALPKGREWGMHVLRHTYASVQLAGGVDVRKLSTWLGHEDPGFCLRTYTHFMPDTQELGRKATDVFLAGPSALDVPSAEGEGT